MDRNNNEQVETNLELIAKIDIRMWEATRKARS
jgi:hypothetical protein